MKTISKSIACVLLCMLFYSCSVNNEYVLNNEEHNHADTQYNPETDYDNRFGRMFASAAETDYAYYWINHGYIYYYDKESDEFGVFCNRPECIHDQNGANEECDGYHPNTFSINYYKGKLYYDDEIKTENGRKKALFRVDPNGENRELCMYLDHDESFAGQRYDVHRGMVYCWSYETEVEQSVPVMTSKILCWDIDKKTGPECILERTKDTTIVPSIFYFGNYVYILNSWLIRAEEKNVYEIVRWNTENKVLENIMYLETDGNHGDAESIWVEDEQHVYFSVTSDEDLYTNVYLINGNEVSKVIEFGAWGGIRLQQGAAVWFNLNEDKSALAVKIRDYTGNEIYEGTLSPEYYQGIEGPDGEAFGFAGFSALMGDSHDLILIEHIRSEKSSKEMAFLVKYTITSVGAEYHLLGRTFWK